MSTPGNQNQLVNVARYMDPMLGALSNSSALLYAFNKKFKDFDKIVGQLGTTVNLMLPFRQVAYDAVIPVFQGIEERLHPITVDQSAIASNVVADPQYIFNLSKEDFLDAIGRSRILELASRVESRCWLSGLGLMPVNSFMSGGDPIPTGQYHTESGPYRFFGDGVTAINSFQQLDQAMENNVDFGIPVDGMMGFLPNTNVPPIVGSGLTQFATERNNQLANSWMIGTFGTPPVSWYKTNLLPTFYAGVLGNNATVLTVTGTNDPTGANITQITVSGGGSQTDAVRIGDRFQFLDTNGFRLRFRQFTGHAVSQQPVQCRVTANNDSVGNSLTLTFEPALQATFGLNQNISQNIVAGMQIKLLPDRREGYLISGKGGFFAGPQLPDTDPYASARQTDKESGLSLRMWYGFLPNQVAKAFVTDIYYTATIVKEYAMALIFPL